MPRTKTTSTLLLPSLLLPALFLGCSEGSVPVGHEDHRFDDPEPVDLGTQPWRERRRMDIDQLDASLREVTGTRATDGALAGGIGWERWSQRSGEWYVSERYYETFADTLGVPDYINSSSEDLSVSLLFEKFLDDAARDVCRRLADREGGAGRAYDGEPQGIFDPVDVNAETVAQADVDQALANLLLRFHGRSIEPADARLQPWRDLHGRLVEAVNAAETPTPRRAWEGVCIALVTHPDFYTY